MSLCGTIDKNFVFMIRFYRVSYCIDSRYELVDYYLDLAVANARALGLSNALSAKDCLVISQIDVYPSESVTRPIVTINGRLGA